MNNFQSRSRLSSSHPSPGSGSGDHLLPNGRRQSRGASVRRGSATVEFAIVAPLFLALALGAAQNSFNIDTAHSMYAAIRQAGRLASQDADGILQSGQTLNNKVVLDIRNQLKAEGMPVDQMTVTITDPATNAPFDLSSASNDLKLFRIKVEVPYTAMNSLGTFKTSSFQKFSASIVFRKGKNALVR